MKKCVFRWLVLVALGQFDANLNKTTFITSQLYACCCFRAVGLNNDQSIFLQNTMMTQCI